MQFPNNIYQHTFRYTSLSQSYWSLSDPAARGRRLGNVPNSFLLGGDVQDAGSH